MDWIWVGFFGLVGFVGFMTLAYLFPPLLIVGAIVFIHLLLIWTAANSS